MALPEPPAELLPLWLKYPDIPRYSIGWRMGAGEGYVYEFGDWWDTLDEAVRHDYQQRYPEPPGWRGWYTEEDLEEEEGGDGMDDEPWPDAD